MFVRAAPTVAPATGIIYQASEELFSKQKTSSNLADWVLDMSEYTQGQTIGKGGYGPVVLMSHNKTKEEIALKVMRVSDGGVNKGAFRNDAVALTKVHNRCVLGFSGFWTPVSSQQMGIATPYMRGGSLESIILRKNWPNWYTPTWRAIMAVGIAIGMEHIHSQNIIHRSLKPNNILLDECYLPHVADFGCFNFRNIGIVRTGDGATPRYLAPEVFESKYTSKFDTFSYGSILYELLLGERIFADCTDQDHVVRLIVSRQMPAIPDTIPKFMKYLIQECWSFEPDRRPTFRHILECMCVHGFRLLPGVETARVEEYYAWARL